MVARISVQYWYGFTLRSKSLSSLCPIEPRYFNSYDYTQPDVGKFEHAYSAWVKEKLCELFRPLYDLTDEDDHPVDISTVWDKYHSPVRLLGDIYSLTGDLMIAFGRPAIVVDHVEEGVHKFKPFDPERFSRIETAHRRETSAAMEGLQSWGLKTSHCGWFRWETTN